MDYHRGRWEQERLYSDEWKGRGEYPEVSSSTEAEESIAPLNFFRSFKAEFTSFIMAF